jgi:hypothetical protein
MASVVALLVLRSAIKAERIVMLGVAAMPNAGRWIES